MRDKELKLQEVEASRTLGGGVVYFIITQKKRARERTYKGVGVVNDKELKREDVEAPSAYVSMRQRHRPACVSIRSTRAKA